MGKLVSSNKLYQFVYLLRCNGLALQRAKYERESPQYLTIVQQRPRDLPAGDGCQIKELVPIVAPFFESECSSILLQLCS